MAPELRCLMLGGDESDHDDTVEDNADLPDDAEPPPNVDGGEEQVIRIDSQNGDDGDEEKKVDEDARSSDEPLTTHAGPGRR